MRSSLATFLLAATVLATSIAHAQDRRVVVHNAAKEAIFNLYGSNTGTSDWEEDVLGDDVLMGGDSVRVNFDDGTGYCVFDLKVRYESGREETEYGVNVCEVSEVTFR